MAKIGNLKIEYVPVGKIKPWAKNARAHPPEQITAIKDHIERLGFYAPLLVDRKKGRILKGNGTFQAALQLEQRTVPVVFVEGLSEAELRALVIWDNRAAEKSGWDKGLLTAELADLKAMGFDLTVTGFDPKEVELMLKPPASTDPEPAVPALPKHAVTRLGDVWLLGDHRLICGDCTKAATMKALMAGRKAQVVFTDPPYGISYEAPSGSFEVIKGDDLRRGQLSNLLHGAFSAAIEHTREDAGWYVWHASATREDFAKALRDVGLVELGTIIWVKPAFYGPRTETTVWRIDARSAAGGPHAAIGSGVIVTLPSGEEVYVSSQVPKGRKVRHIHLEAGKPLLLSATGAEGDDVWEVSRDNGHGKATTTFHPTQKPVELARRALKNSTKEGEIALDMFSGSASTIVGAEQTGRLGYAAELDPRYVDQGVRRWQELTGKQAIHAAEKKTFDAIAKARAGRKAAATA